MTASLSPLRRPLVLLISLELLIRLVCPAQAKVALSDADRIRLVEAFRFGEELGNAVWKAWDQAPFALLLVTPENEFLFRHPNPSKDFALLAFDSTLKTNVYIRPRKFQPNLSATFPAVNNLATIVIGQAENTEAKTSSPWVVTVLHEHFHQLQYSQSTYYDDVEALNLSHGDKTGMWMLDYPFPYDSLVIHERFTTLCQSLLEALQASKKDLQQRYSSYRNARQKFQQALSPDDYRYYSFQIWQEGVARYTELRVAQLAANRFVPGKEFRMLMDYRSFKNTSDSASSVILAALSDLSLSKMRRVAFYTVGAAEAILLDRINPAWQTRYFSEKFYLEKYFEP